MNSTVLLVTPFRSKILVIFDFALSSICIFDL
jgi:hypothetical protein